MINKIEKGVWMAENEKGVQKYFSTKKEAMVWLSYVAPKKSDWENFEDVRNSMLY